MYQNEAIQFEYSLLLKSQFSTDGNFSKKVLCHFPRLQIWTWVRTSGLSQLTQPSQSAPFNAASIRIKLKGKIDVVPHKWSEWVSERMVCHKQCDQIGRFIGLWATINLPKSPTFLGNYCKGVKSFLGNFYRHLVIFFWSHWSQAHGTKLTKKIGLLEMAFARPVANLINNLRS